MGPLICIAYAELLRLRFVDSRGPERGLLLRNSFRNFFEMRRMLVPLENLHKHGAFFKLPERCQATSSHLRHSTSNDYWVDTALAQSFAEVGWFALSESTEWSWRERTTREREFATTAE